MEQPAFDRRLTGEELHALGDTGPCELIDGRVVPMSPTGAEHGTVEGNIAFLLKTFVQPRSLGWVLTGEVGIYTRRSPDRVRAADVVFVSHERCSGLPAGFLEVAPELVVEVVSPGDRWQDMRQKIAEYFAIGVGAVWVVDPGLRTVLVHASPTTILELAVGQTLAGTGVLEDLRLAVKDAFAGLPESTPTA
jgi:Uma2 family endonuclease